MLSMWVDRRKKYTVTFKVDEYEYEIINDIARAFNESKGEAIRRALWVSRVLYDPNLLVKDALYMYDPNKPLCDVLKPIPELIHILGIEINLWRRQQIQKFKSGQGRR